MNQNVLTSVFMRLRSSLKARASSILGNEDDADDALQEAFCRLWSAKTQIENEGHAAGMTINTVRNISIDMIRRNAVRATDDTSALSTLPDSDYDENDTDDMLNRVNRIIDASLSVRDKEILYKREMYGYSFEDLADEYNLTPDNIRTIVCRARRTIREKYRHTSTFSLHSTS